MATITTLATGGASAGRTAAPVPYLVERYIDFAAAATAKGEALASADVIECISVPVNTVILNAGLEIITVLGGESNDNTFDLGTGVDADVFVDGFDADAAAAGAYAQNAAAFQPLVVGATADTIDITIATATTAPTSGVVRVWAVLMSVDGRIVANEVDRDLLA
jgi:hypothetical protein